jgi:predicted transcriptional regulator
MQLAAIKEVLKARVLAGEDKLALNIEAGAGGDLMSDLLRRPMTGVVILSGLNTLQVIRTAVITGVAALVLVRGKEPDPEMVAEARLHALPVLSTPFTMFTACGRLFSQGLRGIDQKPSE